jgi:hypothetical protein
MGDDKRLGFKDNSRNFGAPFHEDPKLRIGTFVFAGHWDRFQEHGSRESYDKAGAVRGSAGHRPTDPVTLLDSELFYTTGGNYKKDDYTAKPMGAHSHFLYLMPGAETSDEVPDDTPVDKRGRRLTEPVKKHSDDIILRYDPLVYSDFGNPDTPSGMFVKAHFLKSYSWPDPGFSRLPADVKGKDLEQVYKEGQQRFIGLFTHMPKYWTEYAFSPKAGSVFDGARSEFVPVGDKTYMITDRKFYPTMTVKEHDTITIEHDPNVKPLPMEKIKGGFIVEFEKDGHVVGGYEIRVPEEKRSAFSIKFEQKEYSGYDRLEKGEIDLLAHNGAKFERSIVYKNELDVVKDKSMRQVSTGPRGEVLNFKAEMMTDIRYLDIMKENAEKYGLKEQVAKYDMIRKILVEAEQKVQYGDGQTDAAKLKADLKAELEKIRPEIEKHEHNADEPAEEKSGIERFQEFKQKQPQF